MHDFFSIKSLLTFIFSTTCLLSTDALNAQNWVENNIFSVYRGLGTNPKIGSGDVDNDGDIDLIINDFNTICYFPNDGTGSFEPKDTIATGWGLHWGNNLIFVDQEGDGDFDILTSNNHGEVNWLINNGSGDFSRLLVGDLVHKMNDFDLKDIDGDNDLDIIASTHVSARPHDEDLVWFEKTETPNYIRHNVDTNVGFRRFIKALDLDGDGDNDIMTFSPNSSSLEWYENDGSGNFSDDTIIETTFYNDILDFNVLDIDGDGLLDILFSSKATGTSVTAWRKNNGDATFSGIRSINATGRRGIFSISHSFPVDYNLDGAVDVIATGTYNDELSIFLNDGLGNFKLFESAFKYAEIAPYHTCAGDFNGDGILDPACYYDTDPTATNFDNLSWYELDTVPSFSATMLELTCQNNDTPNDGNDDYLEATIQISSAALNGGFLATVNNGSVFPNNGAINNSQLIFKFNPGSAGSGDRTLTITNSLDPSFSQAILIEDTGNCVTTGTESSSASSISDKIIIAPNPAGDFIKLTAVAEPISEVTLFDITGRKRSIVEDNDLIEISSLKAGTYTLRIRLINGQIVSKTVVKY